MSKNQNIKVDLPNKYDHSLIEKKWQKYWQDHQIYKWQNNQPKSNSFVIDTPPPTVSGVLHMGHVFSYVQADFIARYKRMSGMDVFYPMGFDDNGLPTERLVEKIIKKKAIIYEQENGKGSFVKKCHEIVDLAEKDFEDLFNNIALSVDWSQKYQTISPKSQKISQASFIDIYNKGMAEKKLEPVFWDIVDKTALAQADLVDKEVEGVMNDIEFSFKDSNQKITIMTTRPELLKACVAVMVHPSDKRYQKFIGKKVLTALFDVEVPIIADDLVQIDKGTGAVMCCTLGDETDIKWWRKHNLELKIIINDSGKIEGLNIKQYKEQIIDQLKAKNLLLNQETIIRSIKCAERSGVGIEILVASQWFINILDKKQQLIAKSRECNWYPDFMRTRIEQWIDGLSWDWCISRQRFFGVKFPIWYSKRKGEEGKIIIADIDQLPVDPEIDLPYGYDRQEVDYEKDIMDTWATSSISPQLSSHGISSDIDLGENDRHKKLFPADLRPQAHEIIRTWSFYTIVKALIRENTIPWKNLMISGWCLASDKTKMSKSKGNVITPINLIENHGCDVVRYWASTSNLGADSAYSEDVMKIGKKLVTKIFNAAKFVNNISVIKHQNDYSAIINNFDQWVILKLNKIIISATNYFEKFEYAKARQVVEDFFWSDFCDNYLEICKVRAYGIDALKYQDIELDNKQKDQIILGQKSAIITLNICLQNILKLFAPFIPHICDELYSNIYFEEFQKIKSLNSNNNWPVVYGNIFKNNNQEVNGIENNGLENNGLENNGLENNGDEAIRIITQIRKYKSEHNLSMKVGLKKVTIYSLYDLNLLIDDLKNVCNIDDIEIVKENNDDIIEIDR